MKFGNTKSNHLKHLQELINLLSIWTAYHNGSWLASMQKWSGDSTRAQHKLVIGGCKREDQYEAFIALVLATKKRQTVIGGPNPSRKLSFVLLGPYSSALLYGCRPHSWRWAYRPLKRSKRAWWLSRAQLYSRCGYRYCSLARIREWQHGWPERY